MGVLCDFFLCSPAELAARCVGWLPPLEEPRPVRKRNPFTREEIIVQSRQPEIVGAHPHVNLDGLDRLDLRGLAGLSMDMLLKALLPDRDLEMGEPALYGPEGAEEWVHEVPPPAVSRLAALDEVQVKEVARDFTEAMREDIRTIPDETTRRALLDGTTVKASEWVVLVLCGLARRARAEDVRMYRWTSL
jgi:hypothetical protein